MQESADLGGWKAMLSEFGELDIVIASRVNKGVVGGRQVRRLAVDQGRGAGECIGGKVLSLGG